MDHKCHASVNLVYDKKPRPYAEDNRTECIVSVCTGKSEAKLTNNKRLHSRYHTEKANY